MAYVITDECVACGTCAEACPAEAISEGDGKYVIDADACLDCGTCEGECPTVHNPIPAFVSHFFLSFLRTLFTHIEFVSSARRHKSLD